MRIRTVKPDFWTHPVSGRWRGELQAFAISLLNAADDEGYFYADPVAVRSAVRPFDEDSTNVRRLLVELSSQEWIEVRNHPRRGAVGRVRNFDKHQRIDRPKPSEIGPYFNESSVDSGLCEFDDESTTNRRSIDDESLLEGKGTGNREGNREQGGNASESVEGLREAWNNLTSLPIPRWTKGREKEAARALKRRSLKEWCEVFRRIEASDFLRGTKGDWKADIDWALKPGGTKAEPALRVLEGAFDNRTKAADTRAPVAAESVDWTSVVPGEVAL
jgi:hypothetical protein